MVVRRSHLLADALKRTASLRFSPSKPLKVYIASAVVCLSKNFTG